MHNRTALADAPRSNIYVVPIGSFSGYINDTTDGNGIAGVNVQVYSKSLCSTSRCPPTTTASDGAFTVICPAGGGPGSDDAVVITGTNWWMDNVSNHFCVADVNTWVGTIYLVRDGVGIGFVNDPTTGRPIVGVGVQAISRDGSILGYPGATTQANGSYVIALPPVPSRVLFAPPTGYSGSFNFTNATPGLGPRPQYPPWLGGVNLGTMYLIRQTLVQAELYDSQTNGTVNGQPSALQACDANGGGCQSQGNTVFSSTVRAFAQPGWNYFEAYVNNHVESATKAVNIPLRAPGSIFDIGRIYVTPLGTFSVKDAFETPLGGHPFWPAPGVPSIFASVCSMDGYKPAYPTPSGNMTATECVIEGCWSMANAFTLGGAPLRNFVTVVPDTQATCALTPQWPVNGNDPPVWDNYTYVNLTAGHALASPSPVWVNITTGDYIDGNVYITGTHTPPTDFIVTVATTDNQFFNTESYSYNTAFNSPFTPCQSLGSPSPSSFCIAAPPGNSKITVSSVGFTTNWTWVHTPNYCCKAATGTVGWPATLREASANHIDSINITPAYGEVWGYTIVAGSSSVPVPISTISVCPAPALVTTGCENGFGSNGTFFGIAAPIGIDVVTISSAGYASNSVWVNITAGANVSVGTIPLYPLGVLAGRVVDPNGLGLYLSDIHYCTISGASSCYNGGGTALGSGLGSSDGSFNGTVPGGWLPWSTYVVVASAPGYVTDWTYGNVSAGGYTTLPTLVLAPIGVNGTRPVHPAAGSSTGPSAAGAWITGRVIDNSTGQGVQIPGASITACPLGSSICGGIPDGANSEGFFNGSVSPGLYYLNITQNGYTPYGKFFNATQAGFLDLGNLYIEPVWWVSGRVIINPWQSVSLSSSGTYGQGYAPVANAQGCDFGRTTCLSALPVATNGTFNVPVPVGGRATIAFVPSGGIHGNTAAGGFVGNTTSTNLTGMYTNLTGTNSVVPLDIFGVVMGAVFDNNTINDSANQSVPAFFLTHTSVSLLTTGKNSGTANYYTDGGVWIAFLPGGNGPHATRISITVSPAYPSVSFLIDGAIVSGFEPFWANNTSLERFGWIQDEFVSSATGLPIPFVAASAQYADPKTGQFYSVNDVSNEGGFLNLTSPYGHNIKVAVSASDFNGTTFNVSVVNQSATSFPNGTGIDGLGVYDLPEYGWVIANYTNYSGNPPPLTDWAMPNIIDPANGLGIPDAKVSVSSSDGITPSGGSAISNWNGQFYSDAPIGNMDTLSVTRDGFVSNDTTLKVHSGQYIIFGLINLTGDAVLAGRVISNPFHAPVVGATVQVCVTVKTTQNCQNSITNLSGSFWVASHPGNIQLSVSAPGFVTSTSFVRACADCWVSAGTITLDEYGTITGYVRGLPSGFPIVGANVSLCSTLGIPSGPCGPAVTTNAYGHFVISGPPTRYVLVVSDANYNSTYLPVALSPGEITNVGTLFLSQFGTAAGTVYNGATFAPLANAAVYGCANFGEGNCAPLQVTDGAGHYAFSAAPGPYTISVSAQNFQTSYGAVRVAAGVTTTVSPILVYPIGTNAPIPLTGRVVSADNTLDGINGAIITALVNGTSAYSSITVNNGSFHLNVAYGTYQLQAAANGYRPVVQTVVANQALNGILFELPTMTYSVSGVATDGLSDQPLSGATIWSTQSVGGTLVPDVQLTRTDAAGAFSFDLDNGTHVLMATGPTAGVVDYATLQFTVIVNGAPQTDNISMTPALTTLYGRVLDGATGLPLPHAVVTVIGEFLDGVRYSRSFTTGIDGTFSTPLYDGSYSATTSYGQYHPGRETFTAAGPTTNVTLSLTPINTPAATTAATSSVALWAAGGIAVAAIAGAALVAGRPVRRAKPPAPRAPRANKP
jgi:hypothetical protein